MLGRLVICPVFVLGNRLVGREWFVRIRVRLLGGVLKDWECRLKGVLFHDCVKINVGAARSQKSIRGK